MVSDEQKVFENPVEKFEFWTQRSNEKMYFTTSLLSNPRGKFLTLHSRREIFKIENWFYELFFNRKFTLKRKLNK